jgi:hypothetical protein
MDRFFIMLPSETFERETMSSGFMNVHRTMSILSNFNHLSNAVSDAFVLKFFRHFLSFPPFFVDFVLLFSQFRIALRKAMLKSGVSFHEISQLQDNKTH